jgi:antitoxin component YwqK of YwqJK toxin-antitoxin module
LNDNTEGVWEYLYVEEGVEELFAFTTYTKGKKNGPFQDIQGDSLVIGQYRNDLLHGDYRVYLDFTRMIMGGKFNLDTAKLVLYVKGNYLNGKKNGVWHFYDITGSLVKQGRYNNDQMTGEWKFYYPQMTDNGGNSLHYSGELYQIATYRNDQLDGQSQRFSYLEKTQRLCDKEDPMEAEQDTCWSSVYHKILETINFRNGLRHGKYEFRDSKGQIISSGNYANNLREGEWMQGYLINYEANVDSNEFDPVEPRYYFHKGNYRNDKEEGEWTESILGHITQTWQYSNGQLHGKSIVWNAFNKPDAEKEFINGKLAGLIVYDSLGLEPIRKYEIKQMKCIYTEYFDVGYVAQEYWIDDLGESPDFFDFYFSLLSGDESEESRVYPDGEFRIVDYDERPLITGTLKRENRIGQWIYYYYDQDVKIDLVYDNDETLSERYFTIDGQPFSGKFNYVDEEEGTIEVRSVKNGLRHGNTDIIDQKTGKRISREKYREGELR